MATKLARLIEGLQSQISSGRLCPGDRLPTTTQLRQQFGASATTVRYAITYLKAEGLIVGRQGDGVFVAQDGRRRRPEVQPRLCEPRAPR